MIRATHVRPAGHWHEAAADTVVLGFDDRHRRRMAMTGTRGLAFLLDLAEAVALRGGDALVLEDGRLVEVVAAPEPLAEIRGRDPQHLVRLAWHLGNRHLPTQITGRGLRIRRDHVIEDMLRGLGARVIEIEAPFDPEGGAYAGGPARGGALVGWIGVSTAYGLAAALSILAVLFLAGLPRDEPPSGPRRHLLHDLGEGARFAVGHDLLRPILLTAVFFNISWFVFQAVYVAYAVQNLGLTATEVGVTLGIYGAGMIVGAALAPAIARRVSFGTLILIGPCFGFCAAGVMLATLWLPSIHLVGASFFLFGVGPIIWTISTMTLRQAVTPNAMLGRVSALIMTATFGARPLGAAIGATVAAQLGIAHQFIDIDNPA